MFDDNVKGAPSAGWSRLKEPVRLLGRPSPSRRPSPADPRRAKRVQAAFGLLGLLAGAAGAYWAWRQERSIALCIYVFFMLVFYVGRGLGDVVTDRNRFRRFVYFSIYPLVGTEIVLSVHRLWGMWWLGVVLGFLLGAVVWAVVGALFFHDIQLEEDVDTEVRYREARGS